MHLRNYIFFFLLPCDEVKGLEEKVTAASLHPTSLVASRAASLSIPLV